MSRRANGTIGQVDRITVDIRKRSRRVDLLCKQGHQNHCNSRHQEANKVGWKLSAYGGSAQPRD